MRVDRVGSGDNNKGSGRQRMQPTKSRREMGPPNDDERGVMSANYGLMPQFYFFSNQTKDINQNKRMVFACLH
jgi:hypothetical protein